MSSAPNPARCIVSLIMPLAALALLLAGPVMANGGGGKCRKWPQNSLAISPNLKMRHFVLEAAGEVNQLPPSLEPGGTRRVFYRTFTLSIDAAEPIGIYTTSSRRICVIAREDDIPAPIKIPVFFLGREGEASERVKAYANRAVFSRSSSLTGVENFTYVRFHLKKGGSKFSSIQPFFICGLPGAVLCGGSCPADLPGVLRPLIEWVLAGRHWPPETGKSAGAGSNAGPAQPPKDGSSDKETVTAASSAAENKEKQEKCVQVAAGGSGAAAGSKAAQQDAPASGTVHRDRIQAPPAPSEGPGTPTESSSSSGAPVSAAQDKQPAGGPQAPPKQPAAPERASPQARQAAGGGAPEAEKPQPVAPPAPATSLHKLVLAFERGNGAAVGADEILQAEGSVTIGGAPAARMADNLVLSLPGDAAAKVTNLPALQKALPHYEVSAVRVEEARTVVIVKPRFSRVAGLIIKIAGGGNENVSGCDLALDVLQSKRLGAGWRKNGAQNIRFREMKGVYLPALPLDADRNGYLIDTSQDGSAARLLSLSGRCKLEARPFVSAEEIRGGTISRNLHEARGQILIALFSTDSEFSNQVGAADAGGFWTGALGLAASVSEGAWEKKVLGRAQSPGASYETKVFKVLGGGKFAAGPGRDQILKELLEGSRLRKDNLLGMGSEPIKRTQLDMAIKIIRSRANVVPRSGLPRESLLLITGGADPAGGYFCRHPVPAGRVSPAARPWVSGVRKIFAVEVWSDAAARELVNAARAKPAKDAPAGIYACNFPPNGATTALYGVLRQALAPNAKDSTFAYLTRHANSFLRP